MQPTFTSIGKSAGTRHQREGFRKRILYHTPGKTNTSSITTSFRLRNQPAVGLRRLRTELSSQHQANHPDFSFYTASTTTS